MATLDSTVADLLVQNMVNEATASSALNGMAERNSVQGLTVIQNTVIQSVGATADDAQLMAGLNTANVTPRPIAST